MKDISVRRFSICMHNKVKEDIIFECISDMEALYSCNCWMLDVGSDLISRCIIEARETSKGVAGKAMQHHEVVL